MFTYRGSNRKRLVRMNLTVCLRRIKLSLIVNSTIYVTKSSILLLLQPNINKMNKSLRVMVVAILWRNCRNVQANHCPNPTPNQVFRIAIRPKPRWTMLVTLDCTQCYISQLKMWSQCHSKKNCTCRLSDWRISALGALVVQCSGGEINGSIWCHLVAST